MYRRLTIEILDDFNEALCTIQHAINSYYAPGFTLEELKKRVTTANDSFVAMVVSEIWESVNSTQKCVNQAIDLCAFIDSFDYSPEINSNWYSIYKKVPGILNRIYDKLEAIAAREYAFI